MAVQYEDDINIENAEELDLLEYSDTSDYPVFKSVRVTKKDFSIFELFRRYENGRLILEVDFQRKNVWGDKQKSELIESILMGLPLPIFYFKQQDDTIYVVVDGKQRLSTLFDFLGNKFELKNLKILSFLNGRKFNDLVENLGIYQTQLEDYQVYSHVILPPTPDKVLFDIFDRVNRGGTKLNKQEIRNALYHGNGFKMLKRITESSEFVMATRITEEKDSRMKGSYLLTRFLAFYLLFNNKLRDDKETYIYNGDIDSLLEKTLKYLNSVPKDMLEQLEKLTIACLQKSYKILGQGAFRRDINKSKPINMNIFETTMYLMTLINIDGDKRILTEIYEKIYRTITKSDFINAIGNSRDNKNKVYQRFDMIRKIAEEI
ncbi:DUF262 domain-containing protein [Anaeromicropila populeti]|uniref:GmrSD restriction endonucleases N-terminal domain-containing protein n=1 Tax=Anaeromicropila populeti TaxID=37658 RepID=A0A1I6HYH4_9FIRM|nr:DUF262 domain-containing protein [Anaeromicropila populeti]SFR59487.1 Protein of unknown function DUF262 [Anaeromicropila populeti]